MEKKLDRILIRQEVLEETTKNIALNCYQNGVSKDIICQSLNITQQELDNILKNI